MRPGGQLSLGREKAVHRLGGLPPGQGPVQVLGQGEAPGSGPDFPWGLPAAGAGLACAALAAWAATSLEVGLLHKLFGGFLIAIGLSELFGKGK